MINLMTFKSGFSVENLLEKFMLFFLLKSMKISTYFSTNRTRMRLSLVTFFVSFEMPFVVEFCADDLKIY